MSVLLTHLPAVVGNALPFNSLMTADDAVQAVADYVAAYIGEEQYNLTVGIWGLAWTWLYMGMSEAEFNTLLDTFTAQE